MWHLKHIEPLTTLGWSQLHNLPMLHIKMWAAPHVAPQSAPPHPPLREAELLARDGPPALSQQMQCGHARRCALVCESARRRAA